MPVASLILNILWIVFGGWYMALAWLLAAFLMAISIVGLPWARAAFNIAWYALLPFGQTVVPRAEYTGVEDLGTGPLGFVGNLLWLVFFGWWIALAHIGTAVVLAVTIIGLPFAWAHFKLALLALWPIGRMVVTIDEARELRDPFRSRPFRARAS